MNFTDVLGTWKQIKEYIDTKISSSGADSLPVGTLLTTVNNKNIFGNNFELCNGKIYALNINGLKNVKLSASLIDFTKATLCASYDTSYNTDIGSIYMVDDKLYIYTYAEILCFYFKTEKFEKLFECTSGNALDCLFGDRLITVGSLKNTSPYYWGITVKNNSGSTSYKITDISVWYTLLYVAWFHEKYILFVETNNACTVYTTTDFLNFEEIYKTDSKTYFCLRVIDNDHLFFKDSSGYICLINKDFSIKKYKAEVGSYIFFLCIFNNCLYYIDNSYYSNQFHILDLNTGDVTLSGQFKTNEISSNLKYFNVFNVVINNTNYILVSNYNGAASTGSISDTLDLVANAIYPYGDYIYNILKDSSVSGNYKFRMYKMYKNSLFLPEIKNTFCKIK